MAPTGSPLNGVPDGATPARPTIVESRSNYRDDDLLTVAEAGRDAHRSVRTLRRAYLAGRMVAHRDGNGRGVAIRYADLLAWLTADVIRQRSVAAARRPVVRVDVDAKNAPVDTGNLELVSAARTKRAAQAPASAAPRVDGHPSSRGR